MIRTQIQLEKHVWEKLRERAFTEKRSAASIVRELVGRGLVLPPRRSKWRPEDLKFIGIGRATGQGAKTISLRHDEELAKAIAGDLR